MLFYFLLFSGKASNVKPRTGQVVSFYNFLPKTHYNVTTHFTCLLYTASEGAILLTMAALLQLFNTTLWLWSKVFPAVVLLAAWAFISLCRKKNTLADSCDKSQATPFTYRTLGVSCGHYTDCPKVNFPQSKASSSTESVQFLLQVFVRGEKVHAERGAGCWM